MKLVLSCLFLCALALSLVGCGVMMEGLGAKLFQPTNPEIVRQEHETERLKHTQDKIVEARTPEQVQAIEATHHATSKGSHSSFWASIVSALYTEQGRRMALGFAAFASTLGVMIWKTVQARTLGISLDRTIIANQKIRETVPAYSDDIKNTLSSEHAKGGVEKFMRKRVAKVLGEK